jgi:hypothetical protein
MTRTQLAAAMTLLLLWGAPGLAQDSKEQDPPGSEPPVADEQDKKPEPEPEAAPARDDSPYDYQASEEISEDLSVSFPVDI